MRKYIRRIKYTVKSGTATHMTLAIQYNKKLNELMLAGPRRFMEVAHEILEGYFEIKLEEPSIYRNIMKWNVDVNILTWTRGIRELKKNYLVKSVTKFSRLLR